MIALSTRLSLRVLATLSALCLAWSTAGAAQSLREVWAAASSYRVEVLDRKLVIEQGGQRATVVEVGRETLEIQGEKITSRARATMIIARVSGRLQITSVVATALPP